MPTQNISLTYVKPKTILDVLITSYQVENNFAVTSKTDRRNQHKGGHISFSCHHETNLLATQRKHSQLFQFNLLRLMEVPEKSMMSAARLRKDVNNKR